MARRQTAGLCVCLGCGCDARHPCPDLLGDPCRFVVASKSGRLGICSRCPAHLVSGFRGGNRKFTARAEMAIAARRRKKTAS